MLEFIIRDEPYVYFDEMALHSFLTKNKAWSFSDTPVLIPINSGQRLKLSVYGAIGNIFDGPILDYFFKPTNGEDVYSFLALLKEKAE